MVTGFLHAQVSVNLNIGAPPPWGPYGYPEVHYYYLPDLQVYYDVPSSMFIYMQGGNWVHRRYLPARYRDYDLYNGYKVVLNDYHGNAPYRHFNEHRVKYGRGYRGEDQRPVGVRPDRGYPGPEYYHDGYHGGKGKSNGNGNHHGPGNGKGANNEHGNGHSRRK